QDELKDYLAKDIPVEDLVPLLKTPEERELVLKLSYEVLSSNQINQQEAIAYQQLLKALQLPPEVVQRVEQTVNAEMVS
ncbi:MAG: urea ABC transporter ATP-binding protein UrtD, partial [Cyanobacteria bacterium J06638_20]